MNAKTPRQIMPEQNPAERIKNFDEVTLGYTAETAVLEAGRCLQCKKPQCVEGCPVSINIPGFINEIASKNFTGALKIIKETNCLPAICGRVCPQEIMCEGKCILGKKSEPVSIGNLQFFAADYEREIEHLPASAAVVRKDKKAAIIGSGPAGLAAAAELAGAGYGVTVFEALHELGGVMVYGIPEFRLPREIISYEIASIAALGVEFVTNRVIGVSETLGDITKKYDAVFLGLGAGAPTFLKIPGENLPGVYTSNEYLTRINLMKAYKFPEYDTPVIRAKKMAVFGGGNVAMDSARTALRLGCDEVHLIYRRSREEMPARAEEAHHAEEEGVIFNLLSNPVRLIANDEGRLCGVECLRMELGEPDDSGRRRPVEVKGSEYIIEVDAAIVAIGNEANPIIQRSAPDLNCDKWGNILVDGDTLKTSVKGVFAGGDIVTGAATVIEAMSAGKRAAKGMIEYMESGNW